MLQLNFRDAKPIYEQLKDGSRKLIVSGGLEPGDKMLSVRELAEKLTINPNTISRAYRELEEEGYLYTVSGKGTFVADQRQVGNSRKEELLKRFDEVSSELVFLSVSPDELAKRIQICAGEETST